MNLLNSLSVTLIILSSSLGFAYAKEDKDAVLPVLKTMAEPELRAEVGVVPYQLDGTSTRALQHQMMRLQEDPLNMVIDPSIVANLDILPAVPEPNLSSLPLGLQQHVLAIAEGLKSSDPTNGLYIMLQPFGIDRGNIHNIQANPGQLNINLIDRNLSDGVFKLQQSQISK